MSTDQTILYNPNAFTKLFNYALITIVGVLLILSIVGLFHAVTTNNSSSFFLSYLFICLVILLSIVFYISIRRLFRVKYIISLDEMNTITYQTSKRIIKRFTFSDVDSISEEGNEFSFYLKDKTIFFLPFEINNHEVFFTRLFENYKTSISEENLFKNFKIKNYPLPKILLFILFFPLAVLPLIIGNILVIFIYTIGAIFLFLLIHSAKLVKINPENIEIRNNFQTIMISKTEVKKIEFKRELVHVPKGGIKYMYCCELVTNSDKIYRLKNSHISSIDLYCYLTFWTNTVHERHFIK